MQKYVAFLRGVNVGGNGLIKMSELQARLSAAGLQNVRTYIQSGNVMFESDETDKKALAAQVAGVIKQAFQLDVLVALFTKTEWDSIIAGAPAWWGADPAWRHNVLIAITPEDATAIAAEIGAIKPDMEHLQVGNGVLYQSIARDAIVRGATGSKLVGSAAYRKLTIRNYNTAAKLSALLA